MASSSDEEEVQNNSEPDEENNDYFGGKWWQAKPGIPNGAPGNTDVNKLSPVPDPMVDHLQLLTIDEDPSVNLGMESPAERVRKMLHERDDSDEEEKAAGLGHHLFCQMDVLCTFGSNRQGWKEMARWLKYEEKVELGNRWSKPHVATTSLHSIFTVREALASGDAVVALGLQMKYGHLRSGALAGSLTKLIADKKQLSSDTTKQLCDCLSKPHKHKDRKERKESSGSEKKKISFTLPDEFDPSHLNNNRRRVSMYQTDYSSGGLQVDELMPYKPNTKLMKKIPKGTEAANLMIGHCEFLSKPILLFARLMHPFVLAELTEVELPTRFIFLAIGPTRKSNMYEYEEIGRAVGVLMSDLVFCQVAYRAKTNQDLVDGLDEFIDGLTVLPPSVWDPNTRLDPPEKALTRAKVEERVSAPSNDFGRKRFSIKVGTTVDDSLHRTGRLFGGLVADVKRRYPPYWTDIRDGLSIQCVASIIFLYFASIAPTIAFGILYEEGTGRYMGTMETLLSGAICGGVWALFAGQPLVIIAASGPMLVFESLLYSFSNERGMDFLSFRFWIGMWVVLILLIFVAFDLSSLVSYVTRFTEESFSVLISLIFIFEAFKKTMSIWNKFPINLRSHRDLACHCLPPDENSTSLLTTMSPNGSQSEPYTLANFSSEMDRDCVNFDGELIVNSQCLRVDHCTSNGWRAEGTGCDEFSYVGGVCDVFLLCICLFLGTFFIANVVRKFKTTRYFPTWVRKNISAFSVMIAVLVMTAVDALLGLDTPKLNVPSQVVTTRPERTWVVNPMAIDPWYMILVGVIPALLVVILIFLAQQISAVIVNRKEHLLVKGHGYHLDLLVVTVLFGLCSLLGLPWCIAATVRCLTHVRSLVRESETSAPGERPEMLGVREQRVTGFVVHVLLGLSVFIPDVLKLVPMPVLYGVFLYMGITSLAGVQFLERIGLLFMPQKYQPDYIYLRHCRTWRVHLFTVIQVVGMAAMWAVKSVEVIAIAFPLMILAICFARKVLDKIFTRSELFWLDHLLPEAVRRQKEDLGDGSYDEAVDDMDNMDADSIDSVQSGVVLPAITVIDVDGDD